MVPYPRRVSHAGPISTPLPRSAKPFISHFAVRSQSYSQLKLSTISRQRISLLLGCRSLHLGNIPSRADFYSQTPLNSSKNLYQLRAYPRISHIHKRTYTSSTNSVPSKMSTQWPAPVVRKTFLDFFKEKGHKFVPSSPVVPHNDPTLLFTNAGMNQFKSIFLGTVDPSSEFSKLTRATNSQRCIRAGGKHNDLDDVGKDSYHHTWFEMLGNWSFGNYGKKEAIEYSWELLTKVYKLDPKRLYATYFEGDQSAGLPPDLEAKQCWINVGLPEDHILPGNKKDNYWQMAETGPQGPCSEVHYDRLDTGRNAASLVNQDDPQVIEIWNIVFIIYDGQPDGTLKNLPNANVDTGMGFERLVSILQDKSSNYDTDVFLPLFKRIEEVTGTRPYTDKYGKDDTDGIDTAYRVVADHLRTISFAIADSAIPSNVGRGYVVRRVIRRGVRYAKRYLNAPIGSFFSSILPTLVEQMTEIFPELKQKQQDIIEVMNEEELAFGITLDRGEAMFQKYVKDCQQTKKLPGADVWRLYDTYGFPVDLTKIMAEENGLTINDDEVTEAQEKAREASKAEKKGGAQLVKLDVHDIAALEKENVPKTNDDAKYQKGTINGKILAIYQDSKLFKTTSEISEGSQLGIVLDKTNMYSESGGQEFDTGKIVIDGVAELDVQNVQSYKGYVLHTGYLKYGTLSLDDAVIVEYDELRRQPIRNNHTGTHILNYALRDVLGSDVDQKGSLVAPDKLRFDFSHKTGVTDEELGKIEGICLKYIKDDTLVYSKEVDLKIAEKIHSVRAVFGETYPSPVRVVSIGKDVDAIVQNVDSKDWEKYSIEFCGGTHVDRTGEIKELVILEESGIAKGIRRLVCVTAQGAVDVRIASEQFEEKLAALEKKESLAEKDRDSKNLSQELGKLSISTLTKKAFNQRLDKIKADCLKYQKDLQKAELEKVVSTIKSHFEANKDVQSFIGKFEVSARVIQDAIKHVSTKLKDKSVYIMSVDDASNKVSHGCYVSDGHLKQGLKAPEWSGEVASQALGGKAGGKPNSVVGSGTNVDKLDEGIAIATAFLQKLKIT